MADTGALEKEMAADLAKLFDEYPEGPTLDELTEYYGEARFEVHRAAKQLDRDGEATYAAHDGIMRLRPVSPIEASSFDEISSKVAVQAAGLTEDQAAVLGALTAAATDGVAAISLSRLAVASGVRVGNVFFVLGALTALGKIEKLPQLEDLPGNQPNRYRLLDGAGAGPALPFAETPRDVKDRLAADRPNRPAEVTRKTNVRLTRKSGAADLPKDTGTFAADDSEPSESEGLSSDGPASPKSPGDNSYSAITPDPGAVSVLVSILDMQTMNEGEQQAVWTLIRYLKKREAGLARASGRASR